MPNEAEQIAVDRFVVVVVVVVVVVIVVVVALSHADSLIQI